MGNILPYKIEESKLPDNVSRTDECGVLIIKDREGKFRHFLVQKNSGFGKFALAMQNISDSRIRTKEDQFFLKYSSKKEELLKFTMNYQEGDIDSVRSEDEEIEEVNEDKSIFKLFDLNLFNIQSYETKKSDDEEETIGEYTGINGTDSKTMELVRNRTDKMIHVNPTTTIIPEEVTISFHSPHSSNNNSKSEQNLVEQQQQHGLDWIIVKNKKMLLLYKLFTKTKENELNIRNYIKNQYETHKKFTNDPKTEVYKDLVQKIQSDDANILKYQTEVDYLITKLHHITKNIDEQIITDPNILGDLKVIKKSMETISELKCKITDLDYEKKF